MKKNLKDRIVRFVVQDGCLLRTVSSAAGDERTYNHRCELKAFEAVAHALAETPAQGEGTSMMSIAQRESIPYTQANVALEFLKERGVAEVRHRRCYPATSDVYLDAMTEWHALAESASA